MARNALLGLLLAALAACGNARMIRHDQTGGVIELSGDRSHAMEQASHLMQKHCKSEGVTIVSEGNEVVTDDDTGSDSPRSRRSSSETATVGQATAFRVHYACGASTPISGDPNGL